jgi:hypothetical protein
MNGLRSVLSVFQDTQSPIAVYNYRNSTTADQVTSHFTLVEGHRQFKMGTAAFFGVPICWLLSIEPFALTESFLD